MRYTLLFVVLGMATFCHAQKLRRHEITLGYYGGDFFDETPFRFQNLSVNKRKPTFTYTFRWNKKFDTGILYGVHRFGYLKNKVDGILPTNTILGRTIRHYAISGGYRFGIADFFIKSSVGLSYRTGFKAKHLYTYNHGSWVEGYYEFYEYKGLGISGGISIQHPIIWKFFGELSANYIHYRSDFDKKLLMPSYRIGFRF
jgi:hypothetical protein